MIGDINMGGRSISNIATPTEENDVIPKSYVDRRTLDYVVDSGSANGWSYRKWSSGIAECWGMFSHTAASNDFVSFSKDYPFIFSEPPCVTVSGGANGGWIKAVGPYNNTFSTSGCGITYKNGSTDNIESDLNIHAFGRWK